MANWLSPFAPRKDALPRSVATRFQRVGFKDPLETCPHNCRESGHGHLAWSVPRRPRMFPPTPFTAFAAQR